MKCNLIRQKDVTTSFERKNFLQRNSQIPKGKTRMEKITEVVAKAWIICDPNRQPLDPDAIMDREVCTGGTDEETKCKPSKYDGKPEWSWFIPRAEATIKYLADNGYEIVRKKNDKANAGGLDG